MLLLDWHRWPSVAAVVSKLSLQQDPACRLLQHKEVLQALVRNMDLATVLRLFAVSKTLKESVREILPPELVQLEKTAAHQAARNLRDPVFGAGESTHVMLKQPPLANVWKQFVYLLHKVPLLGTNYFYPEVLHIPSVPLSAAVKVIRACGLFTLPQLMSAVRAGVPGVTVWVQAYRQVTGSYPAGLHPVAEIMCCGTSGNRNLSQILHSVEVQDGQEITAADLSDLLYFALTMPQNPSLQGTNDLRALCLHPVARELNADACLSILKAAVKPHGEGAVTLLLEQLPNAQRLSVNGVISLMSQAVDAGLPWTVHSFCQLRAAQQIPSITVSSLLRSAVQNSSAEIVTTLATLPGAEGIGAAIVASLLHVVVEGGVRPESTKQLTTLAALPAAAAIAAATVAGLLQAAVARTDRPGSIQALTTLVALPGAAAIDAATVGRLLQAVVDSADKPGSTQKLTALVALPGAAAIDGAMTASLLAAVLSSSDGSTCQPNVEALAALPGARNIGVTAAGVLLDSALAMPRRVSATAGLDLLSRLPTAQDVDAETCLGLLKTAVQSHGSACVVILLTQLPAAQELPADSIISLIAAVLASEDSNPARLSQKDAKALEALQGAANVGVSVAMDLIHMAVNHGSYGVAVLLLQLPTAQHLKLRQQAGLLQLLAAAEAAGPKTKSILQTMLQLPAAQWADSHHVTELLRMAAQQGMDNLQAYVNAYAATHSDADSGLSALAQTAAVAGLLQVVVAAHNAKLAAQPGRNRLVKVLNSALLEAVSDHEGMPYERRSYKVVKSSLETAAGHELSARHLEPLLLLAAAGGCHTQDHLYKLLRLPAAQQLASTIVTAVIRVLICVSDAQRWAGSSAIGVVLKLSAASGIAGSELSSLVELAVLKEQWHSAARLIRLPAAADFETPDMLLRIVHGLLHGFDDEDLLSTLQTLNMPDLQNIVQWVAKRRSSLALWSGESATKFKSDLRAQVTQLLSYQHHALCESLASVALARS